MSEFITDDELRRLEEPYPYCRFVRNPDCNIASESASLDDVLHTALCRCTRILSNDANSVGDHKIEFTLRDVMTIGRIAAAADHMGNNLQTQYELVLNPDWGPQKEAIDRQKCSNDLAGFYNILDPKSPWGEYLRGVIAELFDRLNLDTQLLQTSYIDRVEDSRSEPNDGPPRRLT